jgi:hypothetical protein
MPVKKSVDHVATFICAHSTGGLGKTNDMCMFKDAFFDTVLDGLIQFQLLFLRHFGRGVILGGYNSAEPELYMI